MDTKKIGAFLKQCRKEKNLTQEQLAEKFEVSARTVSRWETGINMPDLSILVQLAEYYDVEMRELLDGERSQTMNKEMKETLDKVAVYEGWVKQKALKAGNLAFASMFVISVLAIIIQMLLTVDIRLVLGETATALVGGILYASIMVYNGIWDKCLPKSATPDLAAMIAASFRRFSRSAPVKPEVVCAICARSTSSPSGLSFA